MMRYRKIADLDTGNLTTWDEGTVFLTFDMDWCHDEVLSDTLSLINEYKAKATIFVTHQSPVLKSLVDHDAIELGIHPNFNFLLEGDTRYGGSYRDVLDYYLDIVPSAVSVRSHSLTQSSNILDAFQSRGLRFDVNHFIPYHPGLTLKPWQHWTKDLVRVPFFWEDDIQCIYGNLGNGFQMLVERGIKVFSFHPIHLFLNTDNLARYEQARPYLGDFSKLKSHVNRENYGVRDAFCALCEAINVGGL